MTTEATTAAGAEWAWRQQSVWSQTANRLKRSLDLWRGAALWATIAGAVLATLAIEVATLSGPAGRVLALAAAVAVGLVPLLRRPAGGRVVRDWTRARSVSEALKSEVYTFLAGVTPYRGADRGQRFQERLDALLRDVGDLVHHTAGIQPLARELPAVHDVDSYIEGRLVAQVDGYYRPRATRLAGRLRLVRVAEFSLGGLAVVFGALAATLQVAGAVAWIGVVTTVSAAMTAHAAASRYEFELIEYLRTAAELERIRGLRTRSPAGGAGDDDELVQRSEHVISIQNEAWMAKVISLQPADGAGQASIPT
jgi:hypothetical protein